MEVDPGTRRTGTIYLGFDYHIWTGLALGRTLWLLGHPDQAVKRIRETVKDAAAMDQPVTLSIALARAVSVFLWIGDLESAEEYVDWSISHGEIHSLKPYLVAGRGNKAELAIRRGEGKAGVEILQACLKELHAARYELLTTGFNISLAQGLATIGRSDEGFSLIEETMKRVEAHGDSCYLPELLRMKGNILLSMPQPRSAEAEMHFSQSLELSRRQAALAWELRTAIDLAALQADQSRPEVARTTLQPVFARFTEGSDTADLKTAQRLLATLG